MDETYKGKHSTKTRASHNEGNAGVLRQEKGNDRYWTTVLESNEVVFQGANTNSSKNQKVVLSDGTNYVKKSGKPKSLSTHLHSSESNFVRIAPKGPVQKPQHEDGYHFVCKKEGCHQRYKHQSSACRHFRNSHKQTQDQ